MRIKTRVMQYRLSEVEYAALKKRAEASGMGMSALTTRVMRFFSEVELRCDFWNEIASRAKKVDKTPSEYFIDLLINHDNPKQEPGSPFTKSELNG